MQIFFEKCKFTFFQIIKDSVSKISSSDRDTFGIDILRKLVVREGGGIMYEIFNRHLRKEFEKIGGARDLSQPLKDYATRK